MTESSEHNASLQPPQPQSSQIRSRSSSATRRNISPEPSVAAPAQHLENPAVTSGASAHHPSPGNQALSAEILAYSDDPRVPRHLLDAERGRSRPSHYHDYEHYEDFPPQPSRVFRQPRNSSLAHAHLRQADEERFHEEKSWQNSPTLTQTSSPRGSFDEGPKLYTYYQGRYYPMNPETEKAFPSPPVGAAASAYPRGPAAIPSVPLIHSIKNEWQRSSSQARRKSDDMYREREVPQWGAYIRRAFRRRGCLYLLGFITFVFLITRFMGPAVRDEARLKESLRKTLSEDKGFFGVNQRVGFQNMLQVADMERWKVPGSGVTKDGQNANDRRLIIIGDIHGCIDELHALMDKVNYNEDKDHLVTVGDMVSRGPDSPAVLSYLMDHKASCVRGNHEDRVLLGHRDLNSPSHRKTTYSSDGSVTQSIKKGAASDLELAKSLTTEQIEYLDSCPVILDLGSIPGMGPTSVVHAGLAPAVPLNKQDPSSVMTMRSIDIRSHVPSKNRAPKGTSLTEGKDRDKVGRSYIVPWAHLWNAYQEIIDKKDRSTVIYGHDAKAGIVEEDWSYGIDGDCARGGKLAALVLSSQGSSVTKEIVTVDCLDHTAAEKIEGILGDS